eukprot:448191-Ditylum_brightwellii.AAC.1
MILSIRLGKQVIVLYIISQINKLENKDVDMGKNKADQGGKRVRCWWWAVRKGKDLVVQCFINTGGNKGVSVWFWSQRKPGQEELCTAQSRQNYNEKEDLGLGVVVSDVQCGWKKGK